MYKIMIVEDDATIAQELMNHLRKWEYDVACITDFQTVVEQIIAYDPHLVLLDIMLPFFNGFHWCSEIRRVSKVPVIFLSSASDDMNIVMAMNMGGDDFIAKPFELNILTAKIQALLRRTYAFQGQMNAVEHGGALLNLNDATLTFGGETIELTKNEFRILQLLMESPGEVIARDTIMERLWQSDSFIDDNTLTVNIARLRKKLESIHLEHYIVTKKGIGYLVEKS